MSTTSKASSSSKAPDNYHVVNSPEHFQELLSADLQRVSLTNFWAPWAAPCAQMNDVCIELARKYPSLIVLQVDAEEQADIAESFDIESVPTFVILRGHTLLGRISGADAAGLTSAIASHAAPRPAAVTPLSKTSQAPAAPPSTVADVIAENDSGETPAELERRLQDIMTREKVMLFMKGDADTPRCGFSRKAVAMLRDQKVDFGTFDILEDETVRAGLKVVNDWPTFPQFIINGEFIGGLDVVTEMVENGEFQELMASS